MDRTKSRPAGGTTMGAWRDSQGAPRPSPNGPAFAGPRMLAKPWASTPPALARPGGHPGRHSTLIRQTLTSLDLCPLHTHLLFEEIDWKGHDHRHGTRTTNKGKSSLPRPHHLSPTCPHSDQCDHPGRLGLGGLDQPTEKEGLRGPGSGF